MQWTTVAENWPAFLDRIEQRWPRADRNDLTRIDGDRARFAAYLAQVGELDVAEADSEISEWLEGEVPADVNMNEFRDNDMITESGASIAPGEDVYDDDREFGDDNQSDEPMERSG